MLAYEGSLCTCMFELRLVIFADAAGDDCIYIMGTYVSRTENLRACIDGERAANSAIANTGLLNLAGKVRNFAAGDAGIGLSTDSNAAPFVSDESCAVCEKTPD
ncbi:hypothetical protein NPX13_g6070 [Xylaria arbuscula]|uniref:Uncharacterized protein n=1 Tax=Xylaria arbuscula TaxID=114810 RepID=A0A9W8NDK6_9PEZI|nr:hypothetical protein NPX13_g6070 [Xylaria arbuscula]